MEIIRTIKSKLFGQGIFSWFLFLLFVALLVVYPVYTNIMYGQGFCQYTRQIEWLHVNSQFFNPWQYRILSPIIVQGIYNLYSVTIDYLLPASHFFPSENPEVIRYYIVFCLLRTIQHLFIIGLLYKFYQYFIPEFKMLIFCILITFLFFSNAVYDSDFSFNTYFDLIFYLLAALAGIKKKPTYLLFILMLFAALNRETSGFIPLVYAMFYAGTIQEIAKNKNLILSSVISVVIYTAVFISIRAYYGGPAQADWFPGFIDGVKLNFQLPRLPGSFMEIFGATLIFPFFAFVWRKYADTTFRQLALIMLPFWLIIHLSLFIQEARIFLVPIVIILIPMAMQGWFRSKTSEI